VYNDLGAEFIALYGGEPFLLEKNKLVGILECLNSYKDKGKSYTIISNCINQDKIKEIHNLLDSFTASVDCLSEEYQLNKQSWIKSQRGLQTLLWLKEKGVRDCCGIITATKKNLKHIPNTIEYLSKNNIWAGIDFIHWKKCRGQKDLPIKSKLEGLTFDIDDLNDIKNIANELINMKKNGSLIFPTYEVLKMWKNPKFSINNDWKCSYPRSITINPDGSLMECDSYRGNKIKNYNIFDLPEKWNKFSIDYIKDVKKCRNCFWSTHVMLYDKCMSKEYYQHKTK